MKIREKLANESQGVKCTAWCNRWPSDVAQKKHNCSLSILANLFDKQAIGFFCFLFFAAAVTKRRRSGHDSGSEHQTTEDSFFENTNFNFCVAKSRKKTFPTCAHFSLVSGLPTLERCHLHSINDFRGNMFAQTCGNCSELSHFSCCFVVWGDCFCISICELGLMLMIS